MGLAVISHLEVGLCVTPDNSISTANTRFMLAHSIVGSIKCPGWSLTSCRGGRDCMRVGGGHSLAGRQAPAAVYSLTASILYVPGCMDANCLSCCHVGQRNRKRCDATVGQHHSWSGVLLWKHSALRLCCTCISHKQTLTSDTTNCWVQMPVIMDKSTRNISYPDFTDVNESWTRGEILHK